VDDREAYRAHLEQQIKAHPELFPAAIKEGYRSLAGTIRSGKGSKYDASICQTRRKWIKTERY
jgi:hypothetical protein